MTKLFEGKQDLAKSEIVKLLQSSSDPLTVSEIAHKLITNTEISGDYGKQDFRQFAQNVVDRMYRHGELEKVEGKKSTGRPVTKYQLKKTA